MAHRIIIEVTSTYAVVADEPAAALEDLWELYHLGDEVDTHVEAHDADPWELEKYEEEFEYQES